MWSSKSLQIEKDTIKYYILKEDKIISFKEWIDHIQHSEEFIEFYNDLLKQSSFQAFFWEVKPITINRLQDEFEFVLVNSSSLKIINYNHSAFDKFLQVDGKVVSFPNLRADAQLIVPAPRSDDADYAHLAKFVRTAVNSEYLDFWRTVGVQYNLKIGEEKKWLSTSGLGVHWLHVRIDSRPKYYQHQEYRNA